DCWHDEHDDVSVASVIQVLKENAEKARALVKEAAAGFESRACAEDCHTSLEHAVITPPEARDPEMVKRLEAVAGRVLGL
ncbi:MAG: S-methyl-5'-thioadenosine phosphorylase, partial [Proteobacteria bacterium]|nr:S-methyl-5'-thioadenosine phosphorylase [Pseudomonadota bacterium]